MEATLTTSSLLSSIRQSTLTTTQQPPHNKLNTFTSKFPFNHTSLVSRCVYNRASSCSADDRRISTLESLFCYDKAIPEQIIEKPVGLSVAEKEIGGRDRCSDCQAKGAVLCTTCGGSGLYVDSVMECQGIIVKVRCLGCGGTGNIMCSECGGRGHM